MILSSKNPDQVKFAIYDCLGNPVLCALSYNTETKEITIHIPNGSESKVIFDPNGPKDITFVLEGSYAKDEQGNKL